MHKYLSEDDFLSEIDRKLLRKEEKRLKDKDLIETVEEVFDSFTVKAIYEVMRRMKLQKLLGVVSSGKEARIYRAVDRQGKEYAVKIYLTFSSEFKKGILKYISGDPRFEGMRPSSTKKLMSLWARKEFVNLQSMNRAGVRVPVPYAQQENVLVMEFIGEEGIRAPLLKEAADSLEDPEGFYEMVLGNVRKMVCNAGLVHGDLSEYNIMIFRDEPVIIDVSQAVSLKHPNARSFLIKDLNNINTFFAKKYGFKTVNEESFVGELLKCREQIMQEAE